MDLRNLKICFIAGTLGVGGAERQLFAIISTLMRLGSQVSLICLKSGEYWEQPIKNTGVNYYSFQGKGGKIKKLLKIILLLRRIRPQIIQSQHFYTNIYAALSARFLNIVGVGSSRNNLKMEIEVNGIFGMPSFKLPHFFISNSIPSFDYAIALGRNKSNAFYLPNALDTNKFYPKTNNLIDNKDRFTILTIGRLYPQKRFDKFIDLIALLKKMRGKQVKGVLIGKGSLEEDLKKHANQLGLKENEMSFISNSIEPESYLQNADIFVLTSDFEGTPNVVLEAMSCGLPVIATRVGNLPYLIKDGENGFLFNGDVRELCEIVMKLMVDREKMNTISIKARQTIEDEFSIEALERNLSSIYTNIINNV